jgi:3-deoxy-manno-octulosonate cytidylyltransferase (CMP-KDO synthetase)
MSVPMNYAIIIPARYNSSRLPGKPLLDLDGLPMIVRTYLQCSKVCPPNKIYVATDDSRVEGICAKYGIQSILTSSDCLTGTDRVAECALKIQADYYINVQGDEPLFNPTDIVLLIAAINQYPGEVLNGMCEIRDETKFRSNTIPKVVTREDGRLLYISRAAIPTDKAHGFKGAMRQVCAYVFPHSALETFNSRKDKTALEQIEDIEILRFLELGLDVRMIHLSDESISVDVPNDINEAINAIRSRGL